MYGNTRNWPIGPTTGHYGGGGGTGAFLVHGKGMTKAAADAESAGIERTLCWPCTELRLFQPVGLAWPC
jgi:hypothetical protein